MDIFVSLHGMCHNLYKIEPKEYFTTVPKGVKVFTFAETNQCIYSNKSSEEMMMHFLRNPGWVSSPERNPGGMFEHAKLYIPGSTVVNLLLDSDPALHFGIYELTPTPRKIEMTINTEKTETTYDVERMLQTLKTKYGKTLRNVYLNICSPHTISPHANSVVKWIGRTQPPRKATNKYDSFAMTQPMMAKAVTIQERRIKLDKEGKKRFLRHISCIERPFLRSMSFPTERRNGSVDHIPSQIGRGLGERERYNERGIYFAVDAQDTETNRKYHFYRKKLKEMPKPLIVGVPQNT